MEGPRPFLSQRGSTTAYDTRTKQVIAHVVACLTRFGHWWHWCHLYFWLWIKSAWCHLYFLPRFLDLDRSLNRKRERFKVFKVESRLNQGRTVMTLLGLVPLNPIVWCYVWYYVWHYVWLNIVINKFVLLLSEIMVIWIFRHYHIVHEMHSMWFMWKVTEDINYKFFVNSEFSS